MEYKTDKLRPTQPFLVLETQDFKQEIYLNQGISHFYTFRLEKTKEITTVPDSCVDMLFEYGENGMTAYAIGSPIKALDVEWQGNKQSFSMPGQSAKVSRPQHLPFCSMCQSPRHQSRYPPHWAK